MENKLSERASIIVRSIGERTERLCCELILAQGIPQNHLFVVQKAPFSEAMRKSFQTGIEVGLPWTFCVDADVLLRVGSIEKMLRFADEQDEDLCEIQGFVLDKFFGGPREAGNHLYRTSLLPDLIAQIPEEGVNIRPEFHTLESMRRKGYPYKQIPVLVGLHDFEQFYSDIYRKCFVQAHKHIKHTDLFLEVWRAGAATDPDYQVALKGFSAGIEHFSKVYIDVNQEIFKNVENLTFAEKPRNLTISDIGLDQIEKIINNWVEPDIYKEKFPDKRGLIPFAKNQLSSEEIKSKVQKIPRTKRIPFIIGSTLVLMGDWLQRWAKNNDI